MPRGWSIVVAALVLAGSTGCVQRRMTIRSNPPGALVYVDDYEIGTTPVSTDFTYYGTREIRLVKDGYETLTVKQPIPAPWYQVFPFEFFADNVVPGEIRDERVIDLQMSPQVMVATDQLKNRAEGLRQSTHVAAQGIPIAAPPVVSFGDAPGAIPSPVFATPQPGSAPTPRYTPYP